MTEHNPLTVALLGATGKLGGHYARAALDAGFSLRALARPGRAPVAPQLSLEVCAETFDRPAALDVASVSADRHSLHVPGLECMREEQQLGLGVDGGALR